MAEPMEVEQPVDAAEPATAADDDTLPNGFGLIPTTTTVQETIKPAVENKKNKSSDAMEIDNKQQQEKSKPAPLQKKKPPPPSTTAPLTMADISRDELTRLSEEKWSSRVLESGSVPTFDLGLVEKIYTQELGGGQGTPPPRRVSLLEISQYLENYLWPAFDPDKPCSDVHLLSIVLMVNEKFKEGMPAWECFASRPPAFTAFFTSLLTLRSRRELTYSEWMAYISFFASAFQSLENEMVRGRVLRLVSLPIWHALSRGRLQFELHEHPQLAKHWKSLAKKDAKAAAAAAAAKKIHVPAAESPEATFLPELISDFLARLSHRQTQTQTEGAEGDDLAIKYCERFIWFLSSLLSQLPTRRFLHAVVEDKAVLVKCRLSPFYAHSASSEGAGGLFARLTDGLASLLSFGIDDHTGDALNEESVISRHYERVQQLQRLLFKHWPKLKDAALTNCGTLEKREVLTKFLGELTPAELSLLVIDQLRLVDKADPAAQDHAFLTEVMVEAFERRRPQREVIEAMPLYPTEELLLDIDAVPGDNVAGGGPLGDGVLALPRLNLQFLTLTDYLIRNFHLFRLEAAYEVREDVAEAVRRTAPYLGEDNVVHFAGWSRMAHPLTKFAIAEVRNPKVGENHPSTVLADITIDVRGMRQEVKQEWDQLKQHDVLFVLALSPTDDLREKRIDWKGPVDVALKESGLKHVRGCEVIEIRDQGTFSCGHKRSRRSGLATHSLTHYTCRWKIDE